MSWKLAGTYMGGCNCETVYPCVFLSPPPQGHCAVAIGWHIKEGESAGVNLDDSIVSLAVASPGKMHEVEWTAALYTDPRASKKQCGEEVKTFGGQAGRHSATLASYIGTLLGVAQGDIDSQQNGKSLSLKIPAMVDMDIKAIDGQRGGDCILEGHALVVAPGKGAIMARSSKLECTDHGQS